MDAVVNIDSIDMPAGEYWVGDPCYAIEPHEKWMEWLEAADYENERRYLVAELDGYTVLGISTAYGDGQYTDQHGNVYPVDAGLIGLVPVELVTALGVRPTGMHPRTFEQGATCSYEEHRGVIRLGALRIETDPELDENW